MTAGGDGLSRSDKIALGVGLGVGVGIGLPAIISITILCILLLRLMRRRAHDTAQPHISNAAPESRVIPRYEMHGGERPD